MTTALLKHEWLRTRSALGAVAAVALVLTLVGSALAATRWPLIATFGSIVALGTIGALVPVVQIMLAADYWRSSYARIGYFTQTLPVPGPRIYRAKLLWTWTATIVAVAAAVALTTLAWPGIARGLGYPELNPFTVFADFWAGLTAAVPAWQLIVAALVTLFLGVLVWPVQYFFAASIGSEEPRNRLGAGGPFLVWVVLYVASQIFLLAMLLAVPLGIGTVEGGLGLVSYAPWGELTSTDPENVLPLGVLPGLALVAAYCLWRTARSWRSRVSLV